MRFTATIFLILCFHSLSLQAQDPEQDYYKAEDYLYSNKDSTYFYYTRAIAGFKDGNAIDDELQSLVSLLYANGYYYDLRALKNNLNTYQNRLESELAQNSDYLTYFTDRLLLEKINFYFKLGDYPESLRFIDDLHSMYDTRKSQERDAEYYENLFSSKLFKASIYSQQNKPTLALETYNELSGFIDKHQDSLDSPKDSRFSVNRLKAKAQASLGDFEKAIHTQRTVLKQYNDKGSYSNTQLDILLDLCQNLIEINKMNEAQLVLAKLENNNSTTPRFRLKFLLLKARLARETGNRDLNKYYNKQYYEELRTYREGNNHPDVIKALLSQANDEQFWGNAQEALITLNKASSILKELQQLNKTLTTSKLQLDVAFSYLKIYEQIGISKELLKDILDQTSYVISALDQLQPQFETKLDKQYLINEAYPALQLSFKLLYQLQEKFPEEAFLEQAFIVLEKSKAIELRSIRQAAIVQQSTELHRDLLDRENILRYTINQLEKDVFTNTTNVQALRDSLLRQNEAYGEFIKDVRSNYPDYYRLRFGNEISTLSQTIERLKPNYEVLSFFQAGQIMFAFKISSQGSKIFKIPYNEDVKKKITTYYSTISIYDLTARELSGALASQLYDHFLKPIYNNNLPESLTVIPDGLLHYIPFEALKADNNYVITQTAITYKPSISFQYKAQNTATETGKFYGFAPSFDDRNPLNLASLTYNEREIAQVAQYYDGISYNGKEGTLERFRESVTRSKSSKATPIFHLATHAIVNDTLPEYSFLAFTSKTDDEASVLYAKDLHAENLNGAFVILSACDTGMGKLQNGQGMQSLAQGFSYGGASSLLYSKWSVSDRYTADIMTLFYKHLREDLPKDQALREAKLEYLNTVEDPNLQHPFYWASFVFSGDNSPLKEKPLLPRWLFALAALAIVTTGGIIIYKRINL